MKHASPAEIIAYRDGELRDKETRRHISACPLCRRVLNDVRWLRTHMQPAGHCPFGPEPTTDEIAAYLDEALDQHEMERVERHIRSSDRLLATFDKLLTASMKLDQPLPSPSSVEKLKARLRGPRLLGRLRIGIKDGFRQLFRPAKPGELATGRAMLAMTAEPMMASSPMIEEESAMRKEADYFDAICCEREKFDIAPLESRPEPPPPPPKPSPPKRIEAGRWTIRLVTRGTADDPRLELEIVASDTNKPAANVPLRLEPGWDDPVEALTDVKGKADFPLPDGDSRLEIGKGPELVLEIDADLSS